MISIVYWMENYDYVGSKTPVKSRVIDLIKEFLNKYDLEDI